MNEISNKQPNQTITKPIIITCFFVVNMTNDMNISCFFFSVSNVKCQMMIFKSKCIYVGDTVIILPSIMIDCRIKGFFPSLDTQEIYSSLNFSILFFQQKKGFRKSSGFFFQQQQKKKSRKSTNDSWSSVELNWIWGKKFLSGLAISTKQW